VYVLSTCSLNKKLLANTGFQTVYNHIGLEPKHTVWRYALVIWNLGKWNSVKWNETRRIRAIFACFCVARVCQRQLGFLVNCNYSRICYHFWDIHA